MLARSHGGGDRQTWQEQESPRGQGMLSSKKGRRAWPCPESFSELFFCNMEQRSHICPRERPALSVAYEFGFC